MNWLFASGGQSTGTSSSALSSCTEYSGLISSRIDWFDLLVVQGTRQESSAAPQFESINSLALSLLYGPTLTSVHAYQKNHSFDYPDLCQQSDVSVFFNNTMSSFGSQSKSLSVQESIPQELLQFRNCVFDCLSPLTEL